HDPPAGRKAQPPLLDQESTDEDVAVEVPAETPPRHASAVGAPRPVLQLGDDLHGAPPRPPGDGGPGEEAEEHVERLAAGQKLALDLGDEVLHGRMPLQSAKLDHARLVADLGELVAQELGDHAVLPPVLLAGQELLGDAPVLFLVPSAAARTLARKEIGRASR